MRGKRPSLGAIVWWAILSALVLCSTPRPAQAQANPQSKAERKPSSITGCIDEENGRYVLVDDRELKPVADLEADGFPQEGFAKYLGKKVSVRGTSSPGEIRPLVKVRSIEPISETCAPQQHP
jgi:hypothetical protein